MLGRTAIGLVLALLVALPATGQDYKKGSAAAERGDYAAALKEWRPDAERGNAESQAGLGTLYFEGRGVSQDYAEAAKWFRRAAEQGNAPAQLALAYMYVHGQGVPQNDAEAANWVRKAAVQGLAESEGVFGNFYFEGRGVPRDYREAQKWWRKAAQHGDAQAQFNLGTMYFNGNGVLRDYGKAEKWWRKASEQGNAKAKAGLVALSTGPKITEKIVAAFSKWRVLRTDIDDQKSCHAFSLPVGGNRYSEFAKAFHLMIGHSPKDGGYNFIRVNFVERLKPISNIHLIVDGKTHQLGPVGETNLFSLGEKPRKLISVMMAGTRMKVQFTARNGTKKSRDFSLIGFTRAYNRASTECQVPKSLVQRPAAASRAASKPKTKNTRPNLAGLGSGFFVSPRGEVLTNYHVVAGCRWLVISKEVVSLIASDEKTDLALLKASVRPELVPKFRLGRGIRLGEDLLVAGYPLALRLGPGLSVTKGNVSRLRGLRGDRRSIQITAPIQPGNSGGPVLDAFGNIVGVATSKLDELKELIRSGNFPQNVNFAVNAATVRAFLDSENVAYQVAKSVKQKSTADIAAEARKYTVLVQCWK
jgi:TPR repeat protein